MFFNKVTNYKIWRLRKMVKANDVQLNGRDEVTERFIPITSEPAMPIITVANNQDEQIRGRLKIECTKNYNGQVIRKWLNYYPAEENDNVQPQIINSNDTWNVDFGDHIRGGEATFGYVNGEEEWNEENIQTFTFRLRGQNPNRDDVISYIEDENDIEKTELEIIDMQSCYNATECLVGEDNLDQNSLIDIWKVKKELKIKRVDLRKDLSQIIKINPDGDKIIDFIDLKN